MANQIEKIIHVDMDAFYVSVEQRDNPEYRATIIIKLEQIAQTLKNRIETIWDLGTNKSAE